MCKNNFKSLIIDRQRLDGVFRSAFLSYFLLKEKKIESLVISNSNQKSNSIKLYKKLGLSNFIFTDKEKYNYKNYLYLFQSLYFTIQFSFQFFLLKKNLKLENFKIKNILIGDLMLDQLIRYNEDDNLTKFKASVLIKLIFSTIFKVLLLQKIVKKNCIKYFIVTSYSYMSLSSLAIRVILKSNGIAVMIGGGSYQIFKNYNECLKGFSSTSELNLQKVKMLTKNKKNMKIVNNYFSKRINYKNDEKKKLLSPHEIEISQAYSKQNFSKKKIYKILGFQDLNKPMCVFGLHAFRDANHLYGKLLFESYFQEFIKTIEYLKDKDEFYWVFKIHPYSKRYREEKLAFNIINKMKLKNIHLVPDYISTMSILLAADKLVTSRGTIAIEYASMGKKPIVTAGSYYSNFGFTNYVKNRKNYFKVLIDKNYPSFISTKKKDTAKTVLYIIKNIAANENKFNITKPEHEIGSKKLLNQINKKIDKIFDEKNLIYKEYKELFDKI